MIWRNYLIVAVACIGGIACDNSTSRLSSQQERQFASEGIVRRADDQIFRYTSNPGERSERWEDRRASIIVTRSSLLIHKNEKVGLAITPRTKRDVSVQRSGNRVRIRAGRGNSEVVWSFTPPDDAGGWTRDIRALISGR
jgi:hypothetical protein